MLYFAYGSNLNIKAMQRRCPAAKPVTAAMLGGYRLQFQTYYAVVPDPAGRVPGALFELTPACVRALDAYEGKDYRQTILKVTRGDTGETVDAMAYEKISPGKVAPPTIEYVREVTIGYRDWKLDEQVLRRARYDTLGVGIQEPPPGKTEKAPATRRRAVWDPAENLSGAIDDMVKPRRR